MNIHREDIYLRTLTLFANGVAVNYIDDDEHRKHCHFCFSIAMI